MSGDEVTKCKLESDDISNLANSPNTSSSIKADPVERMTAAKGEESFVVAVKRRRRSTLLPQPVAAGSSSRAANTDDAAATRRKSVRRSVLLCAPPQLSVAEQVAHCTSAEDALSQLLDISIRDSLSQLCQLAPPQERDRMDTFKGVVVLNSEQLAEDTVKQLQQQHGVTLDDVAQPYHRHQPDQQKVEHQQPGQADVTKKLPSASDVQRNERLIAEYTRRTERLQAEHKRWKQLKRERVSLHTTARREWKESYSGSNRIGCEHEEELSSVQRTFLANRPDYGQHLAALGEVVEQCVLGVADCERALGGITARRLRCQAQADQAYYLTEAVMFGDGKPSFRSILRDWQMAAATD